MYSNIWTTDAIYENFNLFKLVKMDRNDPKTQCEDPTQELKTNIPCRLVERIEAYASRNRTTITAVIIEALDIFLRQHNQG